MAQNGTNPAGTGGQDKAMNGEALGNEFAAQSSPSYGGDLGRSFEEHQSSREDWEKRKHQGRRRLFRIVGLLAVLVIVGLVFLTSKPTDSTGSSGGGGGRRNQGPATVTVSKSVEGSSPVYVKALGTVTPVYTVTVYSQITGRVIAVHYREGQMVKKGQPLVDVDPGPYRAELESAEGTLVQARGTLKQAQATLDEAQMDLKRYQDALGRNAIPRQTVEDQQKLVYQDEAAVTADEGAVKADEGTVAYDKVELSYCHIVAPVSGKVGLRLVDPGNTVFSGTGSTLVVITQLQPITVVFTVAEDNLPEIQTQSKQHALRVDAFDRSEEKQLASGSLRSLDNQIDTTTGTLKLRAEMPNGDLALYPNQFVNTRLLVKTLNQVVQVPSAAIQQNGVQAFVYVVQPAPAQSGSSSTDKGAQGSEKSNGQGGEQEQTHDAVKVQNVTVLTVNGSTTAVSGLQPGQEVATSGFDRLENGARVKVDAGKAASSSANNGSVSDSPTSTNGSGGKGGQ